MAPGRPAWATGTNRKLVANLLLALISFGFAMALLEAGIRLYAYAAGRMESAVAPAAAAEPPLHILCDCPFLYRLNPEHPEISAQGLRDREYSIPKSPETLRVLVLGDSITYGVGVASQDTFPKKLEASLAPVEVINSGVQGYTAYNELQYFLHEGVQFEADLVIVAFAMNDVVNPRRHINYAREAIETFPVDAIPNPTYDQEHILPTIQARQSGSPLDNLALYQLVEDRFRSQADEGYAYLDEAGFAWVNGEKWPTFITAEDTLSIQVLMDYQSAEWQWLRGVYDQLLSAVVSSGGRMTILVLPLAYQLDEDYPFLPQTLLTRYCTERSIDCLNVLPAFRAHRTEDLYLDPSEGLYDVWHLSARGHQLVSEELEKYLAASGFSAPNGKDE